MNRIKGLYVGWIAGLLYLLCIACADDDWKKGNDADRQTLQLSGEIEQTMTTRVDDGGFCDGNCTGVYIVDYHGGEPGALQDKDNRITNLSHTYRETTGKWTPAYEVYWTDNITLIDSYGYYPLQKGRGFAGVKRILSYAGEEYTFGTFADNDKIDANQRFRSVSLYIIKSILSELVEDDRFRKMLLTFEALSAPRQTRCFYG